MRARDGTGNLNSGNLWLQKCLALSILLSAESIKADGIRGSTAADTEVTAIATLPPADEDFSSSGHDEIGGDDEFNNIMMQAEDYIIMQMEMQWGMKEMHRYRSHRGEYPTRASTSTSLSLDDVQQPQIEDEGGESDYLDDLPSSSSARDRVPSASSLPSSSLSVHGAPLRLGGKSIVQRPSGDTTGSNGNDTDEEDGDHNDTHVAEEEEEDIPDELALILGAKAARTVEEYWDSLVSMF